MRIFLFSAILFLALPSGAESFAVVKSITGKASFDSISLARGTKVPSGKIIRTENGTQMKLMLPGDHLVDVGPEATALEWRDGRLKTISLTQFHGRTHHAVSPLSDKSEYRVSTPTNVVGVRGTNFVLQTAENGGTLTIVDEGEVLVGEDDLSSSLGPGEMDQSSLIECPSEENWMEENRVRSTDEAAQIEAAVAEKMSTIHAATIEDYSEMALLSREVFRFAARRPADLGDASEGLELLTNCLKLFRRIEARSDGMTAKRELSRNLARLHRISDAQSDTVFREFSAARESKGESLENFIAGLEKLSTVLKAAQAINNAPSLPVRIPFFNR